MTTGDLPEKVAIPVGRKFDTLFFLHSGVGCNPGDKEFFRYVLHYADGRNVTLTIGPKNMRDWLAEPVVRFPLEQDTFSTVAQTVNTPRSGRGSVYRMEWTHRWTAGPSRSRASSSSATASACRPYWASPA